MDSRTVGRPGDAVKVLVYGAGTIGLLHAWALDRSGHDVVVLARPGHEARWSNGVQVRVLDGRGGTPHAVDERYHPRLVPALVPNDGYDLVILTVRWDQAETVLPAVAPNLGTAKLLLFTNNWNGFAHLERLLPNDGYAFGLPHAGGVLDSSLLDGALAGSVVLGPSTPTAGPDRRGPIWATAGRCADLFRTAGFKIEEQERMLDWYWVHFAATAVWAGAVARAGNLGRLAEDPKQVQEALLAGREAMSVCSARGVDVRKSTEARAFLSPTWIAAPLVRRTLRDPIVARMSQVAGDQAEGFRKMYDKVREQARTLGVPTPHLDALAPVIGARAGANPPIPSV